MDQSPIYTPTSFWSLVDVSHLRATSVLQVPGSSSRQYGAFPPSVVERLQLGAVAVLIVTEGFYLGLQRWPGQSSRSLWGLVSGLSLFNQIFILGWIGTNCYSVASRSDHPIDMVFLAVCLAACLASILNSMTISAGSASSRRGLYHLASTLIWSRLSMAPAEFYVPWAGVCQFAFGIAFLLDVFFPTKLASAYQSGINPSTLFGALSYSWINPILASQRTLTVQDLPHIDLQPNFEQYQCSLLLTFEHHRRFRQIYWKFLFLHHGSDLIKASLLRLVDDASKLALPWILHSLLTEPSMQLASILFCLRVTGVLCGSYCLLYLRRVGIHYKAALCAAIHSKALRTRNPATGSVDVSTLSEVDTERLYQNLQIILDIWSYPLQTVLCLAGLSYLLPWQSALAVMLASAAMGPAVNWTSGRLRHWTQKNMIAKDDRTKFTAEVLRTIQSIKAHGWESAFVQKLDVKRHVDVQAAARLAVAYALLVCLVQAIPCILTLAAFGVAFWMGYPLEGPVIFACMLLFTSLSSILSSASSLTLNFQASMTCITRLRDYLTMEESSLISDKDSALLTKSDGSLDVTNINIAWPGRSPLLTNGRISLRQGTLTVVTGPTGSGKTTLLDLLIHLLSPDNARGYGPDRVSFVSQAPFLMRGTIRANILFGKRYDAPFYARVINACALASDFVSFQDGDQTVMNGTATVSGGQKARICLARAVYARCDINIFDDPLAAIDVKLSNVIMKNLFGPDGLLTRSTTLMSSNSLQVIGAADSVLKFDNGSLTAVEARGLHKPELRPQDGFTSNGILGSSGLLIKEPRLVVEVEPELAAETARNGTQQDPEQDEKTATRPRRPIWKYVSYATLGNWLIAIFTLISGRIVSFIATYCLKFMAEDDSTSEMPKFLLWFAALSAAQVTLYLVFILLAYRLCIIPTAKKLHRALVTSTLAHEMDYFEKTPLGDILNYFTNDLARVDLSLSGSILTLLAQYGNIILVGILLLVSAPQSTVLTIPAVAAFVALQRTYLTKLRELRSCDVTSRAAILGFLQDSDVGRALFSVFGVVDERIGDQRFLLEENVRAQFPLSSINSWLAVRLEILCVTMQVLAVTALLHTTTGPGTVGLVMTYVFQITNFLSIITRTTALFEADFVSFARLQGRIDEAQNEKLIPKPETPDAVESGPLIDARASDQSSMAMLPWPSSGKVEFSQFSARYRPGLPLNLDSIDLMIAPGEKVAVIGRTGAGKSSLILALLGILRGASGRIVIDGRDIALMDSVMLRRSLALIPQNPVLFSCSVRENLDPLGLYSDEHLLEALYESTADKALENIRQSTQNDSSISLLDLVVDSKSSFSSGQIQLISLARAILHGSKLLILDEATASLPADSEARFQEILWKKCIGTTVISVMHRLESTLQYDKVLVLDRGSVAAFGSPKKLVLSQNPSYCSMLKEGGLEERARLKFIAGVGP